MARIDELLREMCARGASDLHLTSGFPPFIRDHGEMVKLESFGTMTNERNAEFIREIMPPANRAEFDERLDTDFAYAVDEIGRFRVNVFMDRHGIGSVIRNIPSKVPSFQRLGLPAVLRDFCFLSKGLVLVVGPTGSGKSTTLAAMIDFINRQRTEHIITIEDPIEFVHESRRCLVNQREVRSHTRNFSAALRAALREDPDIVLVGEMRDLETMEIAMETAETGHLVFGTLHTNSAASTVDRIIDKFPADRQNQIRTMLASSLKGVVAQTLCRTVNHGRAAAFEILVATSGVVANIRENKPHMIPSIMQTGRGQGMIMFTDSLFELVAQGRVEPREAYIKAIEKDALLKKFTDHGIQFDPAALSDDHHGDRALDAAAAQAHEQHLRALIAAASKSPDNVEVINALAWYYATMPDRRFRDGSQSVQLAERVYHLTHGTNPGVLHTLAAAYAEAGHFDKALEASRRGLDLARARGDQDLVGAITVCMATLEQGEPIRMAC